MAQNHKLEFDIDETVLEYGAGFNKKKQQQQHLFFSYMKQFTKHGTCIMNLSMTLVLLFILAKLA